MNGLIYERKEHQTLHWLLQSTEFISNLVYLVCRREHQNLKVINGLQSIEIFNDEVKIVILLSVGAANRAYLKFKDRYDVHFIVFSNLYQDESSLNDLYIRMISLKEWSDVILRRSKNEEIRRLYELSNLKIKVSGDNWYR